MLIKNYDFQKIQNSKSYKKMSEFAKNDIFLRAIKSRKDIQWIKNFFAKQIFLKMPCQKIHKNVNLFLKMLKMEQVLTISLNSRKWTGQNGLDHFYLFWFC